jgi:hypothetical protein
MDFLITSQHHHITAALPLPLPKAHPLTPPMPPVCKPPLTPAQSKLPQTALQTLLANLALQRLLAGDGVLSMRHKNRSDVREKPRKPLS